MESILILGDVHGNWKNLSNVLLKATTEHPDIQTVIQLGDFGYAFGKLEPFVDERFDYIKKYWLDGNHENFDTLDADQGRWLKGWRYMSRGSITEIAGKRCMFFGGASSIDKAYRRPHVSWWPQEEITYKQVRETLERENGPIDVIFSHEHPYSFPYSERYVERFGTGDQRMLDALLHKYNPPKWFFAHHHVGDSGRTENTDWVCCPEVDARLLYTIWQP